MILSSIDLLWLKQNYFYTTASQPIKSRAKYWLCCSGKLRPLMLSGGADDDNNNNNFRQYKSVFSNLWANWPHFRRLATKLYIPKHKRDLLKKRTRWGRINNENLPLLHTSVQVVLLLSSGKLQGKKKGERGLNWQKVRVEAENLSRGSRIVGFEWDCYCQLQVRGIINSLPVPFDLQFNFWDQQELSELVWIESQRRSIKRRVFREDLF